MNHSLTSLSTVIPTRDTRDLTLECLDSLERASKPQAHEVIVVDDGSGDGTADAVRGTFPKVRLLRHESSLGFSSAANAGLRLASGSVLLLLNSDTEIAADGLQAMLQALGDDARLGVVGAQLHYPDGAPQWSGGSAPGIAWLFAQASNLHMALSRVPGYRSVRPLASARNREVDWVTGAALAMQRGVWEAVGPFDESFRLYAQDLDFCLRARAAGWRVMIAPAFAVMHHHGATIKDLDGAAGRENPALIWRDLLYWARKHHGEDFARRARLAMLTGGRLRLAARGLARPAIPAAARSDWDARTNALRTALASLYAEGSPATHV